MTTPVSVSGPSSLTHSHAPQAPRFSVPPFTGPATVSTRAATASRWDAGPFVPAPWRIASSPRLVATPVVAATAVESARFTPAHNAITSATISATTSARHTPMRALTPVIAMAVTPTSSESLPALFGHVTDEHPLPSIREFLSDPSAAAAMSATEAISGAPSVDSGSVESASGASAANDGEADLPWINQFLANTPVSPMDAIAGPPDAYRYITPLSSPAVEAPISEHVDEPSIASFTGDALAQPTPLYNTPISNTPLSNTPLSSAAVSYTPFGVAAVPPYVPPTFVDANVDPTVEASEDAHVDAGSVAADRDALIESQIVQSIEAALPSDARLHDAEADAEADAADVALPDLAPTDEWPLDETAHALDALTRDLSDGSAESMDNPARLFGNVATPMPLPAWSDDDLMNIMPTRPVTPSYATPVHQLFAESAPNASAEEQLADTSALAAAQALEVLAQRVRNGELQLPGYDPKMGDAAALVSALAALLGIRLG